MYVHRCQVTVELTCICIAYGNVCTSWSAIGFSAASEENNGLLVTRVFSP